MKYWIMDKLELLWLCVLTVGVAIYTVLGIVLCLLMASSFVMIILLIFKLLVELTFGVKL